MAARRYASTGWDVRHGQKVRVIDEDVLLEWRRDRLDSWPSHQYRLRRLLAAAAEQNPGSGAM